VERRHDLDWLRVLLFALLVAHHAAVGFAPFGADIYGFANDRLGGDGLGLWIYFNHTWRLPALFLVAGIGTCFATARARGAGFMGRRLGRLLVPALFGTFALNLLGGYAIALGRGEAIGFAAFARDWWVAPDLAQVQHLWFLVNLALYTALTWPLFALRGRLDSLPPAPRITLAALALAVTAVAMLAKPHASAIAGDGYQFPWYWGFFAAGYVIGTQHRPILGWLARRWPALFAAGLAGFAVEAGLLGAALADDPDMAAALASGGWAAEGHAPAYGLRSLVFSAAEGLNAWAFALAAMGLAARYLNRPSAALAALGRATFPVYVLHFPLTLWGLYLLSTVPWPWGLELVLLILGVFAATGALYLLADRTPFPVALIGGRPRAAPPRAAGAPV
jgi:peptidoglycan/LPS O-acetylase OafA/YrhL